MFKMPAKISKKFDLDMLLKTCILNGCDYLESIKGIGFKKAVKLVKEHQGDVMQILNQLYQENFKINDSYVNEF